VVFYKRAYFWWLAKEKALGGWPLPWPVTYLRRLNQTIEKIFGNKKAFIILTE
jgi:hypothetical protein